METRQSYQQRVKERRLPGSTQPSREQSVEHIQRRFHNSPRQPADGISGKGLPATRRTLIYLTLCTFRAGEQTDQDTRMSPMSGKAALSWVNVILTANVAAGGQVGLTGFSTRAEINAKHHRGKGTIEEETPQRQNHQRKTKHYRGRNATGSLIYLTLCIFRAGEQTDQDTRMSPMSGKAALSWVNVILTANVAAGGQVGLTGFSTVSNMITRWSSYQEQSPQGRRTEGHNSC
ncbi:hypothetical protein BaRGS_00016892 [Batillaria attramentaria]|uniref:Uncharacterized protein n=1 Tax=Batillaria attramentaria TaxID=370345 RepID=A0ABD0KX64_9CAEN